MTEANAQQLASLNVQKSNCYLDLEKIYRSTVYKLNMGYSFITVAIGLPNPQLPMTSLDNAFFTQIKNTTIAYIEAKIVSLTAQIYVLENP